MKFINVLLALLVITSACSNSSNNSKLDANQSDIAVDSLNAKSKLRALLEDKKNASLETSMTSIGEFKNVNIDHVVSLDMQSKKVMEGIRFNRMKDLNNIGSLKALSVEALFDTVYLDADEIEQVLTFLGHIKKEFSGKPKSNYTRLSYKSRDRISFTAVYPADNNKEWVFHIYLDPDDIKTVTLIQNLGDLDNLLTLLEKFKPRSVP